MRRSHTTAAVAFLLCAFLGRDLAASDAAYPKPPNQGGVYVIAHRGAHQGLPENTLAAYRKAIELGADFVEIDLRTTKDGKLISIHNRSVDAYTTDGTRGDVSELTLREIKSLDIGSRIGSKWKHERVPSFDEILTLCKDKIGIFLDLKEAPIEETARRIRAHGMQQQVLWCISPDQVAAVRRNCPECLPMPDPESEATLPKMLKQTGAKIIAPVWRDFSPTFATKCHAVGVTVFVDEKESDAENWQLLLDWEADGIQTDDPEGLIDFLRGRDAGKEK